MGLLLDKPGPKWVDLHQQVGAFLHQNLGQVEHSMRQIITVGNRKSMSGLNHKFKCKLGHSCRYGTWGQVLCAQVIKYILEVRQVLQHLQVPVTIVMQQLVCLDDVGCVGHYVDPFVDYLSHLLVRAVFQPLANLLVVDHLDDESPRTAISIQSYLLVELNNVYFYAHDRNYLNKKRC